MLNQEVALSKRYDTTQYTSGGVTSPRSPAAEHGRGGTDGHGSNCVKEEWLACVYVSYVQEKEVLEDVELE